MGSVVSVCDKKDVLGQLWCLEILVWVLHVVEVGEQLVSKKDTVLKLSLRG